MSVSHDKLNFCYDFSNICYWNCLTCSLRHVDAYTQAHARTHTSLNISQLQQLERVQKRACRIIPGPAYVDYDNALITLSLNRLATRYQQTVSKLGAGLLRSQRRRHMLGSRVSRTEGTHLADLLSHCSIVVSTLPFSLILTQQYYLFNPLKPCHCCLLDAYR